MYRHVFASVLGVTLTAFAHDEKGGCAEEHEPAARQVSAPASSWKPGSVLVRGDPLPKSQAPLALSAVLARPENGRSVLVEGMVRRACTRMGCWMELAPAEGGPGVRVTFKDHGFFVPTDSAGARARVQGTVQVAELSAAQVEHMRSEGGSMPPGAQREVRLVASGVELRR
jgi:uncharacterized protein DUF4920